MIGFDAGYNIKANHKTAHWISLHTPGLTSQCRSPDSQWSPADGPKSFSQLISTPQISGDFGLRRKKDTDSLLCTLRCLPLMSQSMALDSYILLLQELVRFYSQVTGSNECWKPHWWNSQLLKLILMISSHLIIAIGTPAFYQPEPAPNFSFWWVWAGASLLVLRVHSCHAQGTLWDANLVWPHARKVFCLLHDCSSLT